MTKFDDEAERELQYRTQHAIGRADLVKLGLDKAELSEQERRLASLLGFDWAAPEKSQSSDTGDSHKGGFQLDQEPTYQPPAEIQLDPVIFYRPDVFRTRTPQREFESSPPSSNVSPQWLNKPPPPTPRRLPTPRDLSVELAKIMSLRQEGRRLDLVRYSTQLARLETPRVIPRRKVSLVPSAIQVIVDRSLHLAPIWDDQMLFVQQLFEVMSSAEINVYIYREADQSLIDPIAGRRVATLNHTAGPILALSDLGVCSGTNGLLAGAG